jgi:hypothetical protein
MAQAPSWLELAFSWLQAHWDTLTAVVGLALSAPVVGLLVNGPRSYRLLRLYHLGEKRGGRLQVLGQMLNTAKADPRSVFGARTLFKRTRMRLEYEVLNEFPKPEVFETDRSAALDRRRLRRWRKTLRALVEGADETAFANVELSNPRKRFRDVEGYFRQLDRLVERPKSHAEIYRQRVATWNKGRDALFDTSKEETIELDNVQALHTHFDQVARYFDCLKRLNLPDNELSFTTRVRIKAGFVAPLHLIAGLLRKFDDDWGDILLGFRKDRGVFGVEVDAATLAELKALREIQLFIFDCWLLWGPSIPICNSGPSCSKFSGKLASIQYGFGDENTSVEIVGTPKVLHDMWSGLSKAASNIRDGARAVNADLEGYIANSRLFPAGEVGETLTTSWSTDADGKLLFLVSEKQRDRSADVEEHKAFETKHLGIGEIDVRDTDDLYYSAYLWSIFVTLRQAQKTDSPRPVWVPVHNDPKAPRRSEKPWLDFFSFFEHGNIADPETYDFLKRQLAEKAIGGLAKLVFKGCTEAEAEAAAKAYPLRFAYACSIDHSGCGEHLAFEPHQALGPSGFPQDSLPDLMWRQVEERYPALKDVVLFDYYDKSEHPHSACNLPHDVIAYFDHLR